MQNESVITPSHHPLGASSAGRWLACPGSVKAILQYEQLYGKQPPNKFAAEGTVVHAIAADLLLANLSGHVSDHRKPIRTWRVGDVINANELDHESGDFEFEITEDYIEHATEYAELVSSRAKRFGLIDSQIYVERRVEIPGLGINGEKVESTVDAMLVYPFSHIDVFDFKYGFKPVTVTKNSQLMYYGLGGLFALPEFIRQDIRRVVLHVVQPRNGGVSVAEYSVEDLLRFHQELMDGAERTRADHPPLVGGEHCDKHWCPVRESCPAHDQWIKQGLTQDWQVAMPKLLPMSLPEAVETQIKIERMTPEQIADFLDRIPAIESIIKQVQQLASGYARMANGNAVSKRYKVVQGRSQRKWIGKDGAEKCVEALVAQGVPEYELLAPQKPKAFTQIETLLKKQHPDLIPVFSQFLEKPPGAETLVPIDDPRPAVSNALQDWSSDTIQKLSESETKTK